MESKSLTEQKSLWHGHPANERAARARLPGASVSSSDFCSVRLFNSTLFLLEYGVYAQYAIAARLRALAGGGLSSDDHERD